ncbi:hypothetical protein LR48_Vigan03g291600 [Vigna angularis]|uniref:TRAF-type domain-containing protein n=2 Tax=Phaseolus angularis TaxID=3914 RepID=A0A0L9UAI5_PHAAN|nr:uncharacterized protein HKW66_Vig0059020 [Vigna angularis]KOM39534.1 hypothetical protein LR48_Vigan03g291600 [Vigna angularis]BAT86377.1 hypothetical protein VIGAN_04401800 [Vigna angularis var. angularis]
MDMPTIDVDLGPEKFEEEKQGGPLFHCDLCDTEVVHKLAQMFLPGLASACVDNTSGDLFKTAGSIAVDMRKEMIEYLTQRSESFVAESVILEGGPDDEVSDHPYDIISNLVDDFASSKRNLFSRVSGWLLSEKREDNIEDFVQEMEVNGFWTLERREKIAETLLKNVDFENSYHCNMSFNDIEDLVNHKDNCNFRSIICENEGCNSRFCASHLNDHDSTCPFKIIPCEQKCPANIMRREMDRHCITVCPMKLVNCPFYAIGCRSAVAQCMIEKHRSDDINSHLWHFLKGIYKEASGDDLTRRVKQIIQASPNNRLTEARDVRSLSFIVKDIEAKLEPFKVTIVDKSNVKTDAKNGEEEGGENNMKNSERSITSNMANSSDKVEVSDTPNVSQNEDNKPSYVENEGHEERTQTSNMTNVSDTTKTETDILNDNNQDVATAELTTKTNDEESTQTLNKNMSNEEVGVKNEDEAKNDTKSKFIEDNEQILNKDNNFKDKDDEQNIHNSKMEVKDGAQNNVKDKDIEDDN